MNTNIWWINVYKALSIGPALSVCQFNNTMISTHKLIIITIIYDSKQIEIVGKI